jgi:Zn-dependent protease
MKRLLMLLIPIGLLAMSGCVVAPYGYYHRGYDGPRVAVVAPAPVVVIRP